MAISPEIDPDEPGLAFNLLLKLQNSKNVQCFLPNDMLTFGHTDAAMQR